MTDTPPCPPLDSLVLLHLRALYRVEVEVPFKETSQWDIGFRAGKRHVLDYLDRRIREQEQERNNVHVEAENPGQQNASRP